MRFPRDYMYVISKRRALFGSVFFVVIAVTVLLILFLPKRYEASATVMLNSGRTLTPGGVLLTSLLDSSNDTSPETQLEVVTARPNLLNVIDRLGLEMRPEDLEKEVHVMHPKQTALVKVFARGKTPQQSADVANTLVDEYIKSSKRRHQTETDTTAGDVHRRVEELEKAIAGKDAEIAAWLSEHNLGIPDTEMELKVQELADAQQQTQKARLQEVDLKAQAARLESDLAALSPTVRASETFAVSPVVEALKTELYDLYIKRSKLLAEFNEDQPEVVEVDVQIEEARKSLEDALIGSIEGTLSKKEHTEALNPLHQDTISQYARNQVELTALQARLGELRALVPALQHEVEAIPGMARELGTLTRDRDALAAAWSRMVQQYEELKVQEYANALRPQVVEAASPPIRLARPRPVLYSAVGLLLAIVLGITACVAMESADRRVTVPRDTRDLLGIPSLGAYSRSLPPREADRLWGRLALSGAGTDWRVLAVVPAQSRNGRSTTAEALAEAARRQGHKVVVASAADEDPPLQVDRVPGAQELSDSVEAWRERGDVVILDLAPIDRSPAGCTAARHADRVLLDIDQGADSEAVLEDCLGALQSAPIELLGAAVFSRRPIREVGD